MTTLMPIPPDAPVWFAPVLAACCLALISAIWLPRLRTAICATGFLACLLLGPGLAMLIGAGTAFLVSLIARPVDAILPAMICVFLGTAVAAVVLLGTATDRGWPIEAGYLAAALAGLVLALGFSASLAPVPAVGFGSAGLAAASTDTTIAYGFAVLAVLLALFARKLSSQVTRGVTS